MEQQSYDYRLNIVEDDGDGNSVKVEIEGSYKIPKVDIPVSAKISFTIADTDETLGDVLVNYWDVFGSSYYFSPKKGSALIKIIQ